ncbi:MAG: FAD-binding and (Fe-S)-binding domain-containing protein [Pseudomonadota bacterium]
MNAPLHRSFDRQAADALAAHLRRDTSAEVRFDGGSRALYATDGSLYRQVPIGVVVPRTVEDVVATVAACRAHRAPVLARGAGTSLAGQCCNVAVVVDCSKYLDRIVALDPGQQRARVQPGCVLDTLRDAAEAHHLTFGPDPATHAHNTLGGMIGNNSCGVHSVMAGRTADNVHALDVLTYDGLRMHVGPTSDDELDAIIRGGGRRGEIYAGLRSLRDRYAELIRSRYPRIPRRVSGYNLDELLPERGFNVARALVGTEGSCVTVLEAELRLVPSPSARCLLVLGYPNVFEAADHVVEIRRHGPVGLEGIDQLLVEFMQRKHMLEENRQLLPEGGAWLFVEFGGVHAEEARAKARALMDDLRRQPDAPKMKLFDKREQQHMLWKIRESGLGATAFVPGERDAYPGWEDSAVPPESLGRYLRAFRDLMARYGYRASLYGHFGDGCLHCRVEYDIRTAAGLAQWRAFMNDAADLVVAHGGSLSGEHGDGQIRANLLPKMYGDELMQAFREFKALWDPDNRMNPGKKIDPYPIDANLRTGPDFTPPLLAARFDYPEDRHSFARAVNRCVGVGNCRDTHGGVMCPSYRGTREEMHSTRGRARLLFEMIRNDTLRDRFRSDAVHESLDLCLACKGCKSDCPVNVDMATYKAEFMAHYYRRRLRPRAAYSMGLIWWLSRAAARMPGLANFMLRAPGFGRLSKALGGIARERRMPRYARRSFTRGFTARTDVAADATDVVLWPDTWNNYFFPEVLQAAQRVLEAAGCRVQVPSAPLCCQRPLYAEGMLDLARRGLARILDTLEPQLTAGMPVIGLEPSCVSAFREELIQLFPADERAHRLAQSSMLLSEFLERRGWQPPPLDGKAVVHPHCHHHAVLDMHAEQAQLRRMGLDVEWLDAGCCGMAGSFGFREQSYALSLRIGETALLPRLREAPPEALLVSNGFSCREQIAQAVGRRPLDFAQVADLALAQARRKTRIGAQT